MKILHVCESVIGGTGSYLSELIPHQVKKYGSNNVALLIPENQIDYVEQNIIDAAPQIFLFRRPTRFIGSMLLIGTYLKCLSLFRPNIVHAHSSIAGVIVRMIPFRKKARVIFCPHGWSVDMKGTRYIRKIAEVVERALAHASDRIIVISSHEYNRAMELGLAPDTVSLVPNGIASNSPVAEPAEWRDNRIKVLFAGRFDYQKGVDVLLEAVRGLDQQISLRLVGGIAVNEVILPDPLPQGVENIGWLDRDGVAAQMKSSDIVVIPSRWEGFGLVAIEAMRLSVPVLASAVGGLVEILGNGKYGILFPSEDPAALRNCLQNLKKDELLTLGIAGRERFLSTYTSDKMVQQIDSIYVETVNGH